MKHPGIVVGLCLMLTLALIASAGFASGEERIEIFTAEQLRAFAQSVNSGTSYAGKTVVLTADITLSGEWIPIGNGTRGTPGSNDHYFTGTFDGQGHSITGLQVTLNQDDHGAGMFGAVKDAIIRNVRINGGSVSNSLDAAAGLVGMALGSGETRIENCSSSATVRGAAPAGILSRAYGSGPVSIVNCVNTGTISADAGGKAGGIVCINGNGGVTLSISRCQNIGPVSGGNAGAGGILGYGNGNAVIESCVNTAPIGDASSKYAGGIGGYVTGKSAVIIGCTNSGSVTASQNAGGIVGISTQGWNVTDCQNSGSVTSDVDAGGIVGGANAGLIERCGNDGSVHGQKHAGGVVGIVTGTAVLNSCSGGSSSVTTADDGHAGRIMGGVSSSPNTWGVLMIDDANGDDYSGLGTIGVMGPYTSWSKLVVAQGTLRGEPDVGQGTSIVTFGNAAKWDEKDVTENRSYLHKEQDGWQPTEGIGGYNVKLKPALVNGKEFDSVEAAMKSLASGDILVVAQPTADNLTLPAGVTAINASGSSLTINGVSVPSGGRQSVHQLQFMPQKEPTCTENGEKEHWYCQKCGKYFVDEAGAHEVGKAGIVLLPTGHQPVLKNVSEATCTHEGYTGDWICEKCGLLLQSGEKQAMAPHQYQDGKCVVCGAADPDYTPPPVSTPPKTGDDSQTALWLVAMLVTGLVLGKIWWIMRKHAHS